MFHGRWPGLARYEVDAFRRRVGMDEVESRRSYLVAQRENSEDRLKPARGAEQMAGRRFCGAYRDTAGTTEYRLDCLQFTEVTEGG